MRRTRPATIIPMVAFALIAAVLTVPAAISAGDISGILQAAERQFNSGNYTSSIATLQSAVTQNPNSAETFYWLGRNYYELRDYDNAIANAEKSVQLDPKNSLYHMWLGRAFGGKADRERSYSLAKKVKKEFQAAVQLNPSNVDARRALEEYDLDAPWIVGGDKDEAKAQVEAIAAIDPVEGHLARAMQYLQEKKTDLAENEYREVLKAKSNKLNPYFEAAMFFLNHGKPTEAEAAIQAAGQVTPNDPRLSYYRGVSRVVAGMEQSRAEEYLKSYLASTPDRSDWPTHADARYWLGRLYEAEGKRAEAAEQFRASLQLDPTDKETKARLQQLEKKSH